MEIKCIKWDSCKPYKWASVVLVILELVINKNFGNFINRQQAIRQLK